MFFIINVVFNNNNKHNNTMNTLTAKTKTASQQCIIGLAGKSKSGKTTLAKELQKQIPMFKIYSFAAPVKECALLLKEMFKIPYADRIIHQIIGTEMGRGILSKWLNDNIWIYIMDLRLGYTTTPLVIIDDVRFNDEAEFIFSWGGYVFMLDRVENDTNMDHESEKINIKNCTQYFLINEKTQYSEIAKYIIAEYLI